jgi:GNAT superfamily N-acetyltransferase
VATAKALIVELLPPEAADDGRLVEELTDRINRAYEVGERGMWVEGTTRIDEAEVAGYVRAGEIAVARRGEEVVGSARIVQLDPNTGEFGLLVADPEHRGIGVGRELVRFAEELARSRGSTWMELELVVPRDWEHPVKRFLHDWYSRLGYREARRRDFAAERPERLPLMATDCDFLTYRKRL